MLVSPSAAPFSEDRAEPADAIEPLAELVDEEDDRPTLERVPSDATPSMVMRASSSVPSEDDRPTLEEECERAPSLPPEEPAALTHLASTSSTAWASHDHALDPPPFVPNRRRQMLVVVALIFALSFVTALGFAMSALTSSRPRPVPTAAFQ